MKKVLVTTVMALGFVVQGWGQDVATTKVGEATIKIEATTANTSKGVDKTEKELRDWLNITSTMLIEEDIFFDSDKIYQKKSKVSSIELNKIKSVTQINNGFNNSIWLLNDKVKGEVKVKVKVKDKNTSWTQNKFIITFKRNVDEKNKKVFLDNLTELIKKSGAKLIK